MRYLRTSLLFFFILLVMGTTPVFAQTAQNTSSQTNGAPTLGLANMVLVKDPNVQDGAILSSSDKGAVLSTAPYDPQVLGVVARDAGIIVSNNDSGNTVPVISDGSVYVLVSTQQGPIRKDDILTTSTIPGVGVKALKSGYVLGYALEDYTNPDPKKIGKIAVNLSLHYYNSKPTLAGTLTDILKIAVLPTKSSPSPIFKYIVAALVVLGSFVLGFLTFARTAAKGIEALGRNPAASAIIHLGIILNVIIVVFIILSGLGVAFLILRL